jgi:hypothetical protein
VRPSDGQFEHEIGPIELDTPAWNIKVLKIPPSLQISLEEVIQLITVIGKGRIRS